MNKFNIHRFGHLLRADIITNRKQHISAFLSVFSLSLLLLFFSYYKPSLYGWEIVAPSRELAADILSSRANRFFMMMFPLFMTYNLSMTFSHLLTKQQRISYILLLASPLEKFLSRLLQHTVLFTLYILAGICLADLIRMAVFPLFGHAFPSALPQFFRSLSEFFVHPFVHMNGPSHTEFWGTVLLFLLALSSYLIYLVGSAFFRRRAFGYTLLAQMGLFFILAFTFFGRGHLLFSLGLFDVQTMFDLLPLFCLLALLFCAGCLWWSYRHIATLPVISRRGLFKIRKK